MREKNKNWTSEGFDPFEIKLKLKSNNYLIKEKELFLYFLVFNEIKKN